MRAMILRTIALVTLAAVLLSVAPGESQAALLKKPVMDDINDIVAVLHKLNLEIYQARENLEIVRASLNLTQRQYEAQKALYDSALEDGNERKAQLFRARLLRLEKQMENLKRYDFEKIYGGRIAALEAHIEEVQANLEARIIEYEALFGERPHVDLSFERDLEQRFAGRRADLEYYLKPD